MQIVNDRYWPHIRIRDNGATGRCRPITDIETREKSFNLTVLSGLSLPDVFLV